MTSLLEKTISVIAPHHCFLCSKESNILCSACHAQVFGEGPEVCFLCNKPTSESSVCTACRPSTAISHVWMAATYDGVVKRMIRAYKFDRVRAAYRPLALAMAETLPYFDDTIVVHIPSAPERVRQRGYDHARLLAHEIAKIRGWHHQTLLRRQNTSRQVGASRKLRFVQADGAFTLSQKVDAQGKHILLVDDVTTSGATLAAAAALLVKGGAIAVDAVVVAKHTLDQS